MKFHLIQRGKFIEDSKVDGKNLYGRNGVIDLDYMEAMEFEIQALPRALRRVLYNLDNYVYSDTGIYTKDNDQLILFASKDDSKEIIESIKDFIENSYHLCRYSELEKIPTSSVNDILRNKMLTDFWWCIDIGIDWMAFLNSKREMFEKGLNCTNEWWLEKPESERKNEYRISLHR